ncbi:MAG: radical SAM protein [Deltaproteobacteria bacterium]|nr:radical SAM protein [Deltaproteobacteria bacterium]
MKDQFRIDSHKLMFHPRTVARWLEGETIYPLYMELSPSGACNHRCSFCALDYLEYRPRFLSTEILKERVHELGRLGLKSLMLGGEGEPLLHRDCAGIISHAKGCGIDVALTTNGVLLDRNFCEQALTSLSWIKASINAGLPETYARIHRSSTHDFDTVLNNLSAAVEFGRKVGSACVIGAQIVLLPENAAEVENLAHLCREAGLSYLVIKPYSQHHKSLTREFAHIDYTPFLPLLERLEAANDESFRVILRDKTIRKMQREKRGYGRCLALPFWSYVDAGGDVWGCSSHMGDERYFYGNINHETFQEIWLGERRRRSLEFVAEELDPETCRMNCRMDEINLYLWELTHSTPHINFI